MADEKLVDLPAAGTLDGTELLYSVQQGLDVKVLTSNMLPAGSQGELQYNSTGVLGTVSGSSWGGTNLFLPRSLQLGANNSPPGVSAQLIVGQGSADTGSPCIVMNGNIARYAGLGNKSITGADNGIFWFAQTQNPNSDWTAATSNPLHLEIPNGYFGLGVAAVTHVRISGPSSGVLAVMNSSIPQAVDVYNTADVGFTTPINYEKATVGWITSGSTSICVIGSSAGGTGTVRDVRVNKGSNTFFTTETSSVGGLVAAGVAGRRHFVTDASTNTFGTVVASGGAFKVPVFDDGTNWRIG